MRERPADGMQKMTPLIIIDDVTKTTYLAVVCSSSQSPTLMPGDRGPGEFA